MSFTSLKIILLRLGASEKVKKLYMLHAVGLSNQTGTPVRMAFPTMSDSDASSIWDHDSFVESALRSPPPRLQVPCLRSDFSPEGL